MQACRGREVTILKLEIVFVALGSNIDPESNLPHAVRRLSALGQVLKVSRVCQSAPVGFVDQADFCNAAALLATGFSPAALRVRLRRIEAALGRERDPANKNAPRTIDLDITIFGELRLQDAGLLIPDPEICSRAFLAAPLAELAPEFVLPGDGRTLREIASIVDGRDDLLSRGDIKLMGDCDAAVLDDGGTSDRMRADGDSSKN